MEIKKSLYGTLKSGEEVYEYVITNGNITAHILNYGGIILKLFVNGVNVVLRRNDLDDYVASPGYLGAVIGRVGNRIENATFKLNGTTYNVGKNDVKNSLHGGVSGFNAKIWGVEELPEENALLLSYTSLDGEEGYPGELKVKVKYTVTKENGLKIEYFATSDKDTICNLTNHAYFNLNGDESGPVYDHTLKMNSSFYTPITPDTIPTGEVLSVEGTPFDFREEKKLGEAIKSPEKQITDVLGLDHNFVLDGSGIRSAAVLTGDKTGIKMEMITNQPGVQLYSANYLTGRLQWALCLETQGFPNSINTPHFPSTVLKKGDEYYHITEYRFTY